MVLSSCSLLKDDAWASKNLRVQAIIEQLKCFGVDLGVFGGRSLCLSRPRGKKIDRGIFYIKFKADNNV